MAIVAVDVFALISGYLMGAKPWSLSKSLHKATNLWLKTIFWSGSSTLVLMLVTHRSKLGLLKYACLPLSNGLYWYFSAYVLLLMLLPVINRALQDMQTKELGQLVAVLLFIGSTFAFVADNGMRLGGGYSCLWLLVLYITGAYIQRVSSQLKELFSTKVLVACVVVLPVVSLVFEWIYSRAGLYASTWIQYNTPLVVAQALALFELLTRIQIQSDRLKKCLVTASGAAFTVYLLDCNNLFYGTLLLGRFAFVTGWSCALGVPFMLAVSLALFCVFLVAGIAGNALRKRLAPRFVARVRRVRLSLRIQ